MKCLAGSGLLPWQPKHSQRGAAILLPGRFSLAGAVLGGAASARGTLLLSELVEPQVCLAQGPISKPRIMKCIKASQLGNRIYRVRARRSSKKVWRVGKAARMS